MIPAIKVWQSRPKNGAPARPMARTAPLAPTPKTTAKKSTSRSPGKATMMLISAPTKLPIRRPNSSGAAPSSRPITVAMTVAEMANTTVSRVATSTR